MATRRRAVLLFIVLLSLSNVFLSGDAVPQGYNGRHSRAHKCSNKLAGAKVQFLPYTPRKAAQKAEYAVPTAEKASYDSHSTAAPYVTAAPPRQQAAEYSVRSTPYQSPARGYQASPPQPYQSVARPQAPYKQAYQPAPEYAQQQPNPFYSYPYTDLSDTYDPYEYPGMYDCEYGSCRCGRSLATDDDAGYAVFNKYHRRSADERPVKPLPFADESAAPADFYRNYRPYVRDSDGTDDESEEQPNRRSREDMRQRLFVVYRADAFDGKPSDSVLDSPVREAMSLAAEQKTQEDSATSGRKPEAYRHRYEHDKQRAAEIVDFEPLNNGEAQRFNLSPGPLLTAGESFVAEEGDDARNPGVDQSKWTAVPAFNDLEMIKSTETADEIEAADAKDYEENSKKGTIAVVQAEKIEKKVGLIEDVPTPLTATEATNFEKPTENVMTSAPMTKVSTR